MLIFTLPTSTFSVDAMPAGRSWHIGLSEFDHLAKPPLRCRRDDLRALTLTPDDVAASRMMIYCKCASSRLFAAATTPALTIADASRYSGPIYSNLMLSWRVVPAFAPICRLFLMSQPPTIMTIGRRSIFCHFLLERPPRAAADLPAYSPSAEGAKLTPVYSAIILLRAAACLSLLETLRQLEHTDSC